MTSLEDRIESKMKKLKNNNKKCSNHCFIVCDVGFQNNSTIRHIGHHTKSSLMRQQRRRILGERTESYSLGKALRGAALEILQILSEKNRNKYSTLTAALEFRLGDEHLKQVFAADVNTKTKRVGESLQEFEANVKRLVRLAYSDALPTFQERLATETFVNGIRDVEVKKVLQVSRNQTSFDALIRALEVEVAYSSQERATKSEWQN